MSNPTFDVSLSRPVRPKPREEGAYLVEETPSRIVVDDYTTPPRWKAGLGCCLFMPMTACMLGACAGMLMDANGNPGTYLFAALCLGLTGFCFVQSFKLIKWTVLPQVMTRYFFYSDPTLLTVEVWTGQKLTTTKEYKGDFEVGYSTVPGYKGCTVYKLSIALDGKKLVDFGGYSSVDTLKDLLIKFHNHLHHGSKTRRPAGPKAGLHNFPHFS